VDQLEQAIRQRLAEREQKIKAKTGDQPVIAVTR
jgi:hypothetical protein